MEDYMAGRLGHGNIKIGNLYKKLFYYFALGCMYFAATLRLRA